MSFRTVKCGQVDWCEEFKRYGDFFYDGRESGKQLSFAKKAVRCILKSVGKSNWPNYL